MVADIGAFLEIQLEQAAHQPVLHVFAGSARPADQAVRIERVRRDLDGVEGEGNALGLAQRLDAGMDFADALLAAELGQHVFAAVLALAAEWSDRAGTAASVMCTSTSPTAAIALSSRFWPMKHQGQTTSDTTSTVMEFSFAHLDLRESAQFGLRHHVGS